MLAVSPPASGILPNPVPAESNVIVFPTTTALASSNVIVLGLVELTALTTFNESNPAPEILVPTPTSTKVDTPRILLVPETVLPVNVPVAI